MAGLESETSWPDKLAVPLYFLDRSDVWKTIKPYSFQYYPKADVPRHNLEFSPQIVQVVDVRSCDIKPTLEIEGFTMYDLPTRMRPQDFLEEDLVASVYCREVEQFLFKQLGAKHVRALDYQVRRKLPEFPHFNGKLPNRPQPGLLTHVDVTADASQVIIRDLFGDLAAPILKSHYQIITVWRPLTVPVRDWPLAICDARTVDRDDLVPHDVIYPTFVTENYIASVNKRNQWYWFSDQTYDQVVAFKSVDSMDSTSCPCPHGAFPLPERQDVNPEGTRPQIPLRESIDMRLVVLYADLEYPSGGSDISK